MQTIIITLARILRAKALDLIVNYKKCSRADHAPKSKSFEVMFYSLDFISYILVGKPTLRL